MCVEYIFNIILIFNYYAELKEIIASGEITILL